MHIKSMSQLGRRLRRASGSEWSKNNTKSSMHSLKSGVSGAKNNIKSSMHTLKSGVSGARTILRAPCTHSRVEWVEQDLTTVVQ